LVLAYLLPDTNRLYADTLNPAYQKPDYLAQTDSAGRFQLNYLVEGQYRLIAINDKIANRRYDFAQEEFAVPFHPVRTGMTNVLMRFALEPDTTELELQVAEARHAHSVILRFNRDVAPDSLSAQQFVIFDSTAQAFVAVYDLYSQIEGRREQIVLVTDSLIEGHLYAVRAFDVKDRFGFSGDSLVAVFTGNSTPDTSTILWQPTFADSTKNLLELSAPSPKGRTLPLQFSGPISRSSLPQALVLELRIGKQYQPVDYQLFFIDATRAMLRPQRGFELGAWYRLTVNHGKLRSALNKPVRDTLIVRHFQIVSEEQFGTIEGTLTADSAGHVLLHAELLGTNVFYPILLTVQPDATGIAFTPFTLQELPEGRYFLSAFYPKNPNPSIYEAWDGGRPFPFRYAERFTVGFDSIRVRKRWTTTGARLRFSAIELPDGKAP
jgi:hypothetical protein